jgi:hypothetical protein
VDCGQYRSLCRCAEFYLSCCFRDECFGTRLQRP